MELKGLTINFLGDSITEGSGTTAPEKRFFELMKKEYSLKEVNGHGIGGTRIARQDEISENPRWDMYFASRIDEMTDDADVVVVFGGTNDFGHGKAPIGSMSDRCDNTFYGALHDLYTRLINKYSGKPIVIMTPLHRITEDEIRIKHGVTVTLKTYVDIIREVAEYYSLPVCDLFATSGIQPCVPILKEKFAPDGLHPNDAGHKIIAKRLGNFLLSL